MISDRRRLWVRMLLNTSEEMPVVGSTTPGAADATASAHASSVIIADLDARVRGEGIVVMVEVNASSQGALVDCRTLYNIPYHVSR